MLLDGKNIREPLDRRRLENAFILFAYAKVSRKYPIDVNQCIIIDRSDMIKYMIEDYYAAFVSKWSGK